MERGIFLFFFLRIAVWLWSLRAACKEIRSYFDFCGIKGPFIMQVNTDAKILPRVMNAPPNFASIFRKKSAFIMRVNTVLENSLHRTRNYCMTLDFCL
uniref:Putative secreted protein n=1 Tax=Ixodes ricinus TaxID=34613 RepID=A0A6B0UI47_IXORI